MTPLIAILALLSILEPDTQYVPGIPRNICVCIIIYIERYSISKSKKCTHLEYMLHILGAGRKAEFMEHSEEARRA